MRKIVIPQDALNRHKETLGEALLWYLDKLANGVPIIWGKGKCDEGEKNSGSNIGKSTKGTEGENRESNKRYANYYRAENEAEKSYWRRVHDEFKIKFILTATPDVLLEFARDNKAELDKLGSKSDNFNTVVGELFAWDKFRAGEVLVKSEPIKCKVGENNKTQNAGQEVECAKITWSKDKGWSFAEFVRQLDVRYCPYCNAETVGAVDIVKREVKTTKQTGDEKIVETPKESFSAIDHILPKGDYPLLALSLYNLVPACYRCNSQFKHEEDPLEKSKLIESGGGKTGELLRLLHPYVHNIHKWFRFDYRPRTVEHLFLNEDPLTRNKEDSPLVITRKIPEGLPDRDGKRNNSIYFDVIRGYLDEFHILDSYRDLYATEINEILKMEMICTPTFVETMKGAWPGMGDEDFDLVFRRTSLDPREINKHRFAKLIIDLHKQIGDEVFLEEWGKNSDEEQSAKARREAHQAAWEARKKVIEESFHEKLSSSSAK